MSTPEDLIWKSPPAWSPTSGYPDGFRYRERIFHDTAADDGPSTPSGAALSKLGATGA